MTRRRALLTGVVVVTVLVLVAALAVWLLGRTRFDIATSSGEEGSLTVETRLPAATCRKVLSPDFPWVRFACDPREDTAAEEGAPAAGAAPAPNQPTMP